MEELKLTVEMIPKSPVVYSSPVALFSPSTIIDRKYYEIDFDVYLPTKGFNLQRGLCWSLDQKQRFILSILNGLPILPVYANYKVDLGKYEIIDGKQRITTLYDFYSGKFPLTIGERKFFFDDLVEPLKSKIRLFDFDVCQHYEYSDYGVLSDDDKIRWFLFINNTIVPQGEYHLHLLRNSLKL